MVDVSSARKWTKVRSDQNDRIYFLCQCHHHDHLLYFELDVEDEGYETVNVGMMLNHNLPLRHKIINAVRYVLGKEADYGGHFDDVILSTYDVEQLDVMLLEFLSANSPNYHR